MDCAGFDSVELVMGVEEIFNIHIPDTDAEQIRTLDDLLSYVMQRVTVSDSTRTRCVSAQSFYVMRRRFLSRFEYPRRLLRPGTAIADILPANPESRMQRWREMEYAIGVRLPTLTFSGSFVAMVGFLSIFLLSVAAYIGHLQVIPSQQTNLIYVAWTLALAAILSPFAIVRLFWRSKSSVPWQCSTLGDISMLLLCQEFGRAKKIWTRDEIWQTVRWLTARSTGVKPLELHRETTFMELNVM